MQSGLRYYMVAATKFNMHVLHPFAPFTLSDSSLLLIQSSTCLYSQSASQHLRARKQFSIFSRCIQLEAELETRLLSYALFLELQIITLHFLVEKMKLRKSQCYMVELQEKICKTRISWIIEMSLIDYIAKKIIFAVHSAFHSCYCSKQLWNTAPMASMHGWGCQVPWLEHDPLDRLSTIYSYYFSYLQSSVQLQTCVTCF